MPSSLKDGIERLPECFDMSVLFPASTAVDYAPWLPVCIYFVLHIWLLTALNVFDEGLHIQFLNGGVQYCTTVQSSHTNLVHDREKKRSLDSQLYTLRSCAKTL